MQRIKNTLIYITLKGLKFLVRWLPYRIALSLGGLLGAGFYAWVPREREKAVRNLGLVFPDMTGPEKTVLIRRVFISVGRNALEFMKMNSYTTEQIIRLVEGAEGREHMEAAYNRGQGVVCLTAHLGNWEILPIFTNQQGWPSAVVAQRLYDSRLDAMLNRFREKRGVVVIKRGNITREIIRCLRSGMLLGVLNDQDTSVDSRWAPFFGRMAKTPVGMLRLARKTGAAVVPIFIARQASGRIRIYVEPAISLPKTGNEESDLLEGARLCNQQIEKYVRRFPEQWVWFHSRWKSRPGNEK
jgi:KDO2-lipid IV(A) lauroyltransferase